MTQLTLGIDRLSNKALAADGYQLPSMDKQAERRFGRLMIKKAKADKLFNPYKNKVATEKTKEVPTHADLALDLAWGKGVTTAALVKRTGLASKSASNVMAGLVRFNYLKVDPSRKVGRFSTWVLTDKGRDRVAKVQKRGSGQRRKAKRYANSIDRDTMLKLSVLGVTSAYLSKVTNTSSQRANRFLQDQREAGNITIIGRTNDGNRSVNIYGITMQGEYVMKGGVL